MPKTIISDTSCLIVLTNIAELDLLRKTNGTIVTTVEISMEFGEPLPNWIIIEKVSDKQKQQLLELQIDKGESSAIAREPGLRRFRISFSHHFWEPFLHFGFRLFCLFTLLSH
jgi:hypothetical protein